MSWLDYPANQKSVLFGALPKLTRCGISMPSPVMSSRRILSASSVRI